MRIVFMGTPDFAVPSLKRLEQSAHEIAGVVTVPDCRKGRGLKIKSSPVKKAADELGLPVLQPADLKDEKFIEELKKLEADCFIVVGFCILPPVIFNIPPYGTVNLHASLLPKYRGAAPIQWALIKGEEKTGVTTFFIRKKVDTGNILLQKALKVEKNDTCGTLHDKLANSGADLMVKTVDLIESGDIKPVPQKGNPSRAPKITMETGRINWEDSADEIVNLCRGLSPRPGVHTFWNGKRIKLFDAEKLNEKSSPHYAPGTVVNAGKDGLDINAGKGIVRFQGIQLEGKKRMDTCEFIRGTHISSGTKFG